MASSRAKSALWGFIIGGLIGVVVGGYALIVLAFGSATSGTVGNCSKNETYGRTAHTNYLCAVELSDGSVHTVTYDNKPSFGSHATLTMWHGSVVDTHREHTRVWVWGLGGALLLAVCGSILLVIRRSDRKQFATTTATAQMPTPNPE